MAKTRNAKKAYRSSLKKRVFNLRRSKAMKESVKEVSTLIKGKKGTDAAKKLPTTQQAIDKAVKRGIIKANAGARMKSRLAKGITAVSK